MRNDATKGAERESVLTKVADAMDYIEPFLDKFPRPEKGYARTCDQDPADTQCHGGEGDEYPEVPLCKVNHEGTDGA